MHNNPLRLTLLKQISDLESRKSELNGTPGTVTSISNLIDQADLDYQIKTARIQATVAQSPLATEILEHFIEDGGQIQFVDPEKGYPVRARLYQDKEQQSPVIALTPEDRDEVDIAIAVAECLKAYDEYILEEDGMDVFESYDSKTEELFKYEDKEKFQETNHPIYPIAKEFGHAVENEIKEYKEIQNKLTSFIRSKETIATSQSDSSIKKGIKITFYPN